MTTPPDTNGVRRSHHQMRPNAGPEGSANDIAQQGAWPNDGSSCARCRTQHGKNQRNDPSHPQSAKGGCNRAGPPFATDLPQICHRSAADLPPRRAWPQHRGQRAIFSTSRLFFGLFRGGCSPSTQQLASKSQRSSRIHVVLNPGSIASITAFSCAIVRCRIDGIPSGICCCFQNSYNFHLD